MLKIEEPEPKRGIADQEEWQPNRSEKKSSSDDEVSFGGIDPSRIEEKDDRPNRREIREEESSSNADSSNADSANKENAKEDTEPSKNNHHPNHQYSQNRHKKGNPNHRNQHPNQHPNQKQHPNKNKNKNKKFNKKSSVKRSHDSQAIAGEYGPIPVDRFFDLGELQDLESLDTLEGIAELKGEHLTDENVFDFSSLYDADIPTLREALEELSPKPNQPANRWRLLGDALKALSEKKRPLRMVGYLEMLSDGNGLLVYTTDSYSVKSFSIFVPAVLIKENSLLRGHRVEVLAIPALADASTPVAVEVLSVMGESASEVSERIPFTELVPYYPTERILLEYDKAPPQDACSLRTVDLITPIGFGQRGLIVAPPRTGKTVLLQGIANSIVHNYPKAHLIILLVDERPEEVTDFKKHVDAEIVSSTFDEDAESHVHAAEMVIDKARRMVEGGKDVIILLDSITRLARAYNTVMPNSGKILSGGVEANALQRPKRFFGSARNIENGGSLTIMGTALVETGSKMDEVIFEEFKGTGNMELHLDRALVEKRIYPALNWAQSGTRKEELLYHADEMNKIYSLRRAMKGVPSTDAMEMLIQRVKKSKTNAEFLMKM